MDNNNSSILILGRQPQLAIAELEALYGPEKLQPIGENVARLELPCEKVDFQRLGGSIKLAQQLTVVNSRRWPELLASLKEAIPQYAQNLPEGKLKLGISIYNVSCDLASLNRSMFSLKKDIKNSGRSVRIIPNKALSLNSAQVLYNKLTSDLGLEIIVIGSQQNSIIAVTKKEQDIDAYSARDHQRPKRDSKVGMLPPKLAQTIVNLADRGPAGNETKTLLDPFCGTGVILQEASLMGFKTYGTDIDQRMIDYSRENLEWLADNTNQPINFTLELRDAMKDRWDQPFDVVAGETYLGRPLSSEPDTATMQKIVQDCNHIHKKFLENIASQIKPGTPLALAVPVWRIKNQYIHLPVLDHLEEIGYTEASFVHVKSKLIYRREDQIVGRELVILNKADN